MQNCNNSFLARRANGRTRLFDFFLLLLLAISPLVPASEVSAALITFDEYPVVTVITDQYRNLGVVFSGDPENQRILTPYPILGDNLSPTLLTSFTLDSYVISMDREL